ncbi:hypothetical protein AN958_00282 [Leucoagaricus sp. SymC.cos]|nr:hypothetical protein AN958_00282 [Leucoagaricus sp. SymC.cos]
MASTDSQANWYDLPVEILERICEYLDYPSLLSLSHVNHQLNYVASINYLGKGLTDKIVRWSTFSPLTRWDDEYVRLNACEDWNPIRVLPTAFWLKELRHIFHAVPTNASHSRSVNDVRHITSLLNRMSNPVLESLQFTHVYESSEEPNKQLHLKLWRELLEAAFAKGCRSLTVQERNEYDASRNQPATGQQIPVQMVPEIIQTAAGFPKLSVMKRLFWRILPRPRTASSRVAGPSSNAQIGRPRGTTMVSSQLGPTLQVVRIWSNPFFEPPLLPFTIGIFHCHAERICPSRSIPIILILDKQPGRFSCDRYRSPFWIPWNLKEFMIFRQQISRTSFAVTSRSQSFDYPGLSLRSRVSILVCIYKCSSLQHHTSRPCEICRIPSGSCLDLELSKCQSKPSHRANIGGLSFIHILVVYRASIGHCSSCFQFDLPTDGAENFLQL